MLPVVLFVNGVIDLAAGLMLVALPALGLSIPGNQPFGPVTAFIAGGWGIVTLALGVGRVWAAFTPRYRRMWGVLGIVEATGLGFFTILYVIFTPVSLTEALMPLCVGVLFSVLYVLAFTVRRPTRPA